MRHTGPVPFSSPDHRTIRTKMQRSAVPNPAISLAIQPGNRATSLQFEFRDDAGSDVAVGVRKWGPDGEVRAVADLPILLFSTPGAGRF